MKFYQYQAGIFEWWKTIGAELWLFTWHIHMCYTKSTSLIYNFSLVLWVFKYVAPTWNIWKRLSLCLPCESLLLQAKYPPSLYGLILSTLLWTSFYLPMFLLKYNIWLSQNGGDADRVFWGMQFKTLPFFFFNQRNILVVIDNSSQGFIIRGLFKPALSGLSFLYWEQIFELKCKESY